MLNLKGLAEMFVIDAASQGHSSCQIMDAFKFELAKLKEKEELADLKVYATELTKKHVQDEFSHAMGEFWEGDEMDRLKEAMKIRFPKHHKTIDTIEDIAAEAGNEREDHDHYFRKCGPTAAWEKLWERCMKRIDKLPW